MTNSLQEPTKLLHDDNATSQLRPDLKVTFITDHQISTTFAVDVSLVSPFEGSYIGIPKVNFNGAGKIPTGFENKLAEVRVKEKNNKYKKACTDRGYAFVPFVVNSTGKIHPKGVSFLKKLANHGAEARGLPAATLLRYYIKLINVALIKQIAWAVNLKTLESVSPSLYTTGMDQMIRTGNAVALEVAYPQLAVHLDPRAVN